MKANMESNQASLAVIGIDIGKEVFHIVGLGVDGKIAFRRKIRRLGLKDAFEKLPPCIVGMEACLSAHFVSRLLRALGHKPRIIPAIYVKPFVKGQKNDYNDAEAIAEAALRPNLRVVEEKSQDQLDLQACHRVRSRLVSRRTATINQIRAFLIEQGIPVRAGARALRNSLFAILENRRGEISPRTASLILGLYEDWCGLDKRIETVTGAIEELSQVEPKCRRLMSVPGIGPIIATGIVAAIGRGEAFERGRDFAAWLGLVPRVAWNGLIDAPRIWCPKRLPGSLAGNEIKGACVLPSRPRPASRSPGRIHISDFRQHHLTCEGQPVHTYGA